MRELPRSVYLGFLAPLMLSLPSARAASSYSVTPILPPSGLQIYQIFAINNSGEVAGFTEGSSYQPVLGTTVGSTAIPLPAGWSSGAAEDINDSQQVVGWAYLAPGRSQAFIGTSAGFTPIPLLDGWQYTFGRGINNSGQVVGDGNGPNGQQAFIATAAGITPIPLGPELPRGASSWSNAFASRINDSGQVTGAALNSSNNYQAFIATTAGITPIPLPEGWQWASGGGINNSGQVTGYGENAENGTQAFVGTVNGSASLPLPQGWQRNSPGGIPIGAPGPCINSSDQIVGEGLRGDGSQGGWIWDPTNGAQDLSRLVPNGWVITNAVAINDAGQIVATATNSSIGFSGVVLLTPGGTSQLRIVNPLALFTGFRSAPSALNLAAVLNSPTASSLAADGASAVVLTYQSTSTDPVTFSFSAGSASGGSLAEFYPNYLISPSPATDNLPLTVTPYNCDVFGLCTFLTLLWSPPTLPAFDGLTRTLAVTATQTGAEVAEGLVALMPPPLLLIHGIWSDPESAGFTPGSGGFYDWVKDQYPHNQICWVDYRNYNFKAFDDPGIQQTLLSKMEDILASAAASGMAARTVDIVAHSMGGLVARYFLSANGYVGNSALLPNPVHRLITIGTPHLGSSLATTLWNNQSQLPIVALEDPEVLAVCLAVSSCTLGDVFSAFGRKVDTGVQSLEPGSPQLRSLSLSTEYDAIIGESPSVSLTEALLDVLLSVFLPGQSVSTVFGELPNDTIVPAFSQAPPTGDIPSASAIIPGIVHTSLCDVAILSLVCPDTGETKSLAVWQQAFYWLTGGMAVEPATVAPKSAVSQARDRPSVTATASAPMLNLSGYNQVAASNVTVLPATGSALRINSATAITATSSTKTIVEVLLLQNVGDSTDTPLMFITESPFTISFTPTRLGSATFSAITVFSDKTYALTLLKYTLEAPPGPPSAINVVNAPVASMELGSSTVIRAEAQFQSGSVDVTQVATYKTQSGESNVLSVGTDGTVTAVGNGVDRLIVSYAGTTVSVPIRVGECTYSLSPSSQIVPYAGGSVSIKVAAPSGCSWTAIGGSSWLTLTNATGNGNGTIILTAAPNGTGGVLTAFVELAGIQVSLTQAFTVCTYGLSSSRIDAPAVGASGTVTVSTSCPVPASSSEAWLTVTPLGTTVAWTIAPNELELNRRAVLTVGTETIEVAQSGLPRRSRPVRPR